MHTVQTEILDEFCRRVSSLALFDGVNVAELRALLANGERAKADHLVRLLSVGPAPPTDSAK